LDQKLLNYFDDLTKLSISELVNILCLKTNIRTAEYNNNFVKICLYIGSLINEPKLTIKCQNLYFLDTLIRCLEIEKSDLLFVFNFQSLLSDLWLTEWYEIFRMLQDSNRNIIVKSTDTDFDEIHKTLSSIRIPLDKFELSNESKNLKEDLNFYIHDGSNFKHSKNYKRSDGNRSYNLNIEISENHSKIWNVIIPDKNNQHNEISIERLFLSNQISEFWLQKIKK